MIHILNSFWDKSFFHLLTYRDMTLTHVSMEMRIHWDRLGTERAFHANGISKSISMDTSKQKTFSMDTRYTIIAGMQRRSIQSCVEAGSDISTAALRVVGGDKKGSLESETVKYDLESHGNRTREWLRWRGPAAIVNDRPVLSSEKEPHINKPATVWH
jgi:hypothetical protein